MECKNEKKIWDNLNLKISEKFAKKEVRFGELPNRKENEIEKYIYERGVAYFIPDTDVGAKLIKKRAYNVDIIWMFLDFAKLPSIHSTELL